MDKRFYVSLLIGMIFFSFSFTRLYANSDSQILVTKGLIAYDDGDLRKALHFFKKAVKADPQDDEALYYLGKVYIELGKPEKGLHFLKSSQLPEASLEAGHYYLKKHRYKKAIKYLKNYVSQEKDRLGYYYLGIAYYRLGKYDEAIAAFSYSATDRHLAGPSYIFMGLIALRDKDFKKAKEYFEKAIQTGNERIKIKARKYISEIERTLHPGTIFGFDSGLGTEYDSNVFILPGRDVAEAYGFPIEEVNHPASGDFYLWLLPSLQIRLNRNGSLFYKTYMTFAQKLYFNSSAQEFNIFSFTWDNYIEWKLSKMDLIFPLSFSYYYLTRVKSKYGNYNSAGILIAKKYGKFFVDGGLKLTTEAYGYGNEKDTRRDMNGLRSEVIGEFEYNPSKYFSIGVGVSLFHFASFSSSPENDWKRMGVSLTPSFEIKAGSFEAGFLLDLEGQNFLDKNSYSAIMGGEEYKRRDSITQFDTYLRWNFVRWSSIEAYYEYVRDKSNIDVFSFKKILTGLKWNLSF